MPIHWLVHGDMTSVSHQMPWVGNIMKTRTSNRRQFTVTREMLTAVANVQRWPDVVAGISASFSKFAFVLFCYITNHLRTGTLGNSEFCSPQIPMRFSGNKIHCSHWDQSWSAKYGTLAMLARFQNKQTNKRLMKVLKWFVWQGQFNQARTNHNAWFTSRLLAMLQPFPFTSDLNLPEFSYNFNFL